MSQQNIVLIGFMGTGKSSVGRLIAGRLGFQFIDTDALVVERAGMEIAEIFRVWGEERFRALETETLASLATAERRVISTGGGIVTREENLPLLRTLGLVVLLQASEDVIFERVSRNTKRPLLQTENPRATLHALLEKRGPLYTEAAQVTVDTSRMSRGAAAEAVIAEARRAFAWQVVP